jgi:hypothetical protein
VSFPVPCNGKSQAIQASFDSFAFCAKIEEYDLQNVCENLSLLIANRQPTFMKMNHSFSNHKTISPIKLIIWSLIQFLENLQFTFYIGPFIFSVQQCGLGLEECEFANNDITGQNEIFSRMIFE